jgi:hypothetical protein
MFENSAQTNFRLSPISFCAPHCMVKIFMANALWDYDVANVLKLFFVSDDESKGAEACQLFSG